MVEVKTAELIGYALDWAVGVACKDSEPRLYPDIRGFWLLGPYGTPWNPSADWSQGGPLIVEHAIGFVGHDADNWLAFSSPCDVTHQGFGQTHLIAACRMIVCAKIGDTVQVPEEMI